MARELESAVHLLSENGNYIYSISKLDSFNQCQYQFYNTYVLGNRGIESCYTIMGSKMHDVLEKLYNDNAKKEDLHTALVETLADMEMLGIEFPNDAIRNNWTSDMKHFCLNFSKKDGKYLTEKGYLAEISPNLYIQGYIDLQEIVEGAVDVIDFKTSSKFTKEDLLHKGRQLVGYKIMLEANGVEVRSVGWNMLKYMYVSWLQKNGKTKEKMCNRGKWVKECDSVIRKELSDNKIDEFEIDIMMEKAIAQNSLDNMPEYVKNKFSFSDCIIKYEVTKELEEEFISYVKETHNNIIQKSRENELEWNPVDIESESFFCNVLCGARRTCKHLKKYNDDKNNPKEEPIDFDSLF